VIENFIFPQQCTMRLPTMLWKCWTFCWIEVLFQQFAFNVLCFSDFLCFATGADINAQALNGSSYVLLRLCPMIIVSLTSHSLSRPLHWAAGAGKLDACKLLLQRGAIADARFRRVLSL
jgi:hypothetical protein